MIFKDSVRVEIYILNVYNETIMIAATELNPSKLLELKNAGYGIDINSTFRVLTITPPAIPQINPEPQIFHVNNLLPELQFLFFTVPKNPEVILSFTLLLLIIELQIARVRFNTIDGRLELSKPSTKNEIFVEPDQQSPELQLFLAGKNIGTIK